jgi:ribose/xylose/arabinose/galactoside ABC-type transport system permease subunit
VMVLNYLTIHGVPGTWQTTVTGGLILAAVLTDRLLRRSPA